ncbi:hypothetical protein WDW89_16705 [Deltaproteobacteria bacterium TL4]
MIAPLVEVLVLIGLVPKKPVIYEKYLAFDFSLRYGRPQFIQMLIFKPFLELKYESLK